MMKLTHLRSQLFATTTSFVLLALGLIVWSAALVSAAPGDLDLTFGIDGTVQTDFGSNLNESAQAVAVQFDGRVISVGYAETPSNAKDFAVTRTNPNGTLDTSFNGSGKITFSFSSAARDDIAKAVAVQADGKIVVAGYADVLGFGNYDIVLARLNPDGSFDTSFGTGGKVVTNLNNRADYGHALVLQSNGKIIVAGYSNRPTTGDDFVVVRYTENGSLDTSFNGNGIVITDILTNRTDRANGLSLLFDDKIIVAGYTNDPSFGNNFAVVRYNTNGSLDTSFNGTGKVNTDLNLNSSDFGNAVTLQSDGRIVVAGESSSDFGLVRYFSDGSLDMSFGGGDGIATTNFGTNAADAGRGVVVQSNGKITVAGKSRTELAAARYNIDGTLDTTFNGDGLLIQNAGNNQLSSFGGYWGMTLQSDGKIIAVGDGWRDFSLNDFTVSRINANGTFDLTFNGGDGITSTDFLGRYDETADIAIQTDGKTIAAGRITDSTGAYKVGLAKYNTNGTLDASFDVDGLVVTDIQQYNFEKVQAVAIQTDGKILVAGSAMNPSTLLNDGFLIRYNTNGTLDSSFGTGGIVITPGNLVADGNVWLYPRDIVIQPDGKIVVAGVADYISVYGDGYVARYNSNGSLDGSFITNIPNHVPNGSVVVNFGNNYNYINAVALQPDGRIVIAGWTNEASSDLALARLNTDGSLDTSFDGDGKLTTDFGNNTADSANDVEIQPDGKIIAAGRTDINFIDMAVARYNSDGSLDTTFGGGDGKLNIDFNTWEDTCSAVALQSDGKIILGGVIDLERNFSGFAVVKLTPSGAFDTSFGSGTGRVVTTLGEGVNTGLGQVVNDMALQPDGKIVLAGTSSFNSTDRDFTIVRYENFIARSISGHVTTNGTTGVSGVMMKLTGSVTATVQTDANGHYMFGNLPGGGSYSVTPFKLGYTYDPASQDFSELDTDATADFIATRSNFSISGRVTKSGTTTGLGGVTMKLTGARMTSVTTDANGKYTFPGLPAGGNYTVTPSMIGYSFTPATRSFSTLSANRANQNFAARVQNYNLSGVVKLGTAGLSGVTITLSSPTPAGFTTRTVTTSSTGAYLFTGLPAGRNYTVTPTKAGYQFTPASKSLTNLSANQTTVNFQVKVYIISGQVTRTGTTTGISAVTMTLTSPSPAGFAARTVQTTSAGYYTFANVPAGRNYTIRPTKTGFSFSPATRSFTNLSSNIPRGASTSFTGTP